jgi:lysophospholipase L1-like esterase
MPPSPRAKLMPSTSRHPRLWLATLVILTLSVGSSAVDRPPPPANPAVAPEPRPGPWLKQHESFVAIAARGGADLLFLGDSITALWDETAPGVWSRYYAPRKAVNFGIGGDHTQHILWRLDHGELEGIRPKVVVVLVGTNNIGYDTEDQVVEGVKTVVDRVRAGLPGSKVLLLGVFPRGLDRDPSQVTTAPDPRVARLNARLARLEDGPTVKYLDVGPALLDASGRLVQVIQPDFLHLSRRAYQIWADAMEPTLWEMMEGK